MSIDNGLEAAICIASFFPNCFNRLELSCDSIETITASLERLSLTTVCK